MLRRPLLTLLSPTVLLVHGPQRFQPQQECLQVKGLVNPCRHLNQSWCSTLWATSFICFDSLTNPLLLVVPPALQTFLCVFTVICPPSPHLHR